MLVQIWVALPEGGEIAIGQAGITVIVGLVDGVAAARQTIAIRNINRLARCIVGGPVAALLCRVAPGAVWIPMPDFASELGAEAVAERPKAGAQHFRDRRFR